MLRSVTFRAKNLTFRSRTDKLADCANDQGPFRSAEKRTDGLIRKRRFGCARAGSDSFPWRDFTWFDRFLAWLAKLRLLNPRRQEHSGKQQRGCKIIWRAGHIERMFRINEPTEYSREQKRPNDERD